MKVYDPEQDEFVHGLRKRIKKRIDDCDDLIRDAESYNRNRPECPSFDCEPVRLRRAGLIKNAGGRERRGADRPGVDAERVKPNTTANMLAGGDQRGAHEKTTEAES